LGGGLPYKTKLPYNKLGKRILEQEKFDKIEEKQKQERVKDRVRKMNAYAQMAKELHWPAVSAQKHLEMEKIKRDLTQSSQKKQQISTTPVVYSSFVNLKKGIQKDTYLNMAPSIDESYSRNARHAVSRTKWGKSMYSEEKERAERKIYEKKEYKNYLQEFMSKRSLNSTNGVNHKEPFHPYYDWKPLKKDSKLDDISKVTLMKERAHMLQNRSEQKERLVKSGAADPEDTFEVSNYLIGAIQAKIEILNTLNQEE
jgi:hypothetical protein